MDGSFFGAFRSCCTSSPLFPSSRTCLFTSFPPLFFPRVLSPSAYSLPHPSHTLLALIPLSVNAVSHFTRIRAFTTARHRLFIIRTPVVDTRFLSLLHLRLIVPHLVPFLYRSPAPTPLLASTIPLPTPYYTPSLWFTLLAMPLVTITEIYTSIGWRCT
jgi:hypothetical protein